MMMIDAGMKTWGLMLRQARRTGFAVPWVLSGGVDCGVNVLPSSSKSHHVSASVPVTLSDGAAQHTPTAPLTQLR